MAGKGGMQARTGGRRYRSSRRGAPRVTPQQALAPRVNYSAPRLTSRPVAPRRSSRSAPRRPRNAKAAQRTTQNRQARQNRRSFPAKAGQHAGGRVGKYPISGRTQGPPLKKIPPNLSRLLSQSRSELGARAKEIGLSAALNEASTGLRKDTLANLDSSRRTANSLLDSLNRGRKQFEALNSPKSSTANVGKAGGSLLGTSSLSAQASKELAGTGWFAKESGALSKGFGPKLGSLLTYGSPSGAIAAPLRGLEAAGVPYAGGARKGIQNFVTRSAQDAINLPAEAIPSLYVPAAGAFEAAKGRPQRIEKFWKTVQKTDPVYAAATGQDKEALKRTLKHPLATGVEVYGFGKGIDNAAGFALRRAPSATLKAAGSRERAPLTLPGTDIVVKRQYPKGPVAKSAVRATERAAERKTVKIERRAAQQEQVGNLDRADALRQQVRQRRSNVIGPKELRKQVAETEDTNNLLQKLSTGMAKQEGDRVMNPGKQPRGVRKTSAADLRKLAADNKDNPPVAKFYTDRARLVEKGAKVPKEQRILVNLVTQGIVRPDRADIENYLSSIKQKAGDGTLSKAERTANRQLQSTINRALNGKKIDFAAIDAAAQEYQLRSRSAENKLIDANMLDPTQADIAKLRPFAVRRMGGRVNSSGEFVGGPKGAEVKLTPDVIRAEMARQGRGATPASVADLQPGDTAMLVDQPGTVKRLADQNGKKVFEITKEGTGETITVGGTGADIANVKVQAPPAIRGPRQREPAFVTQVPDLSSASAYYRHWSNLSKVSTGRTGAAVEKGTIPAKPDALREQLARSAGLVEADRGWQRFVDRFGFREPGSKKVGQFSSKKTAMSAAKNLADATGMKWRAVQLVPWGASKERLSQMIADTERRDPTSARAAESASPMVEAMDTALSDGATGNGPWTLIPEGAAEELRQHLRQLGPGPGLRGLQRVNVAFSRAVLSTSKNWIPGNIIEAQLRSTLKGAVAPPLKIAGLNLSRPRARMEAILTELDRLNADKAQELNVRAFAGGHMKFVNNLVKYTDAEQFKDTGTLTENAARIVGTIARTPPARVASDAWGLWTEAVMNQVNGRAEVGYQKAIGGKVVKRLMDPKTRRAGETAIQQAARGLTNTNEQVWLAREIDRAYGRYSKLAPGERAWVRNFTPFIRWIMNATRFVFDVLPRDHPVMTALLASSFQATEEWRKDRGLDLFLHGKNADGKPKGLPEFLQGSIPLGGDARINASRFTPFGAFQGTSGVADQVLPQWRSVIAALDGKDWKGQDLRNKDGSAYDPVQRTTYAAAQFLQSTVPFLGLGMRIKQNPTWQGQIPGYIKSKPKKAKATKSKAKAKTAGGLPKPFELPGGGSLPTPIKMP